MRWVRGRILVWYAVKYEPGPELRDTEQVPLLEPGGIEAFSDREVLRHASDAWYEPDSVKIGYESASHATITSPNRFGSSRKSGPTSWRWSASRKGC